jgi:hypothetical protein
MRATEHYLKAESLVEHADHLFAAAARTNARSSELRHKAGQMVALAQVHATLATATDSAEKVAQMKVDRGGAR